MSQVNVLKMLTMVNSTRWSGVLGGCGNAPNKI